MAELSVTESCERGLKYHQERSSFCLEISTYFSEWPLFRLSVDCAFKFVLCDIGIVQSCEDCQEVTSSKTQKSFVKRELNLLDRSEKAVRITLWGGEAEKFVLDENNPNPVMAIKVGYTRALLEHNHFTTSKNVHIVLNQ